MLRATLLNASALIYGQALTIITQLCLIPLFLTTWGSTLYADWIVLTSVPLALSVVDLGLAQTFANRGAMLAASGETNECVRVLSTCLFWTLLCNLILVLLATGAQFCSLPEILNLRFIGRSDASLIASLLVLNIAFNLHGGVIETWTRIENKPHVGLALVSNRRLLDLIITAVTLWQGGTPTTLALALAAGQAVHCLANYQIIRMMRPVVSPAVSGVSQPELSTAIKPALGYLCYPLAQAITLQGGTQLLNQISSPAIVVGYTMCRTASRMILQIANVANQALRPTLSRFHGAGDPLQAKAIARKAGTITTLFASFVFGLLIIFGPKLLAIWSGNHVALTSFEITLIGMHAVLNVFWYVRSTHLVAANLHSPLYVTYGIAAVLSLVGAIAFREIAAPIVLYAAILALPEISALVYTLLHRENTMADISAALSPR